MTTITRTIFSLSATLLGVLAATGATADLVLGPEEIVQAGGGNLVVNGYSVPSFTAWNGDGLPDLVIGEGGGIAPEGKVRVYLNTGTASAPQFGSYFYAQAGSADLSVPASGCLGAFARVVTWDADGRKDLLIGQADGRVKLFLNVHTDADPRFDTGAFVQVGPTGSEVPIDVGDRATPIVADWNNDGRKDLVVGALDGKVRLYLNEGTDAAPRFLGALYAAENGADLVVPSGRASPHLRDLDGDGRKDLLAGNTEGELLFYRNTGTDAAPSFSGFVRVEADGVPIHLAGFPRSRPFVSEWTGDQFLDVLIGAGDGRVHLYPGVAGSGIGEEPVATPPLRLLTAYPNPFSATARISLELSAEQRVRLSVHDSAGRCIARLADGLLPGGVRHMEWTARDAAGRSLPAGVYLLSAQSEGRTESVKLVLSR